MPTNFNESVDEDFLKYSVLLSIQERRKGQEQQMPAAEC